MWPAVCALIVGSLAALMLTQETEAAPQIRISSVSISRSAWRVACAFVIGLLALAALCASRAEADSIRVSCDIYATNEYDPIAGAHHQHRQFANTSLTNDSTGESLKANLETSCAEDNGEWLTSAGWFPVERNEAVRSAIVYYRTPGPESEDDEVLDIPLGMQFIAKNTPGNNITEVGYNCGAEPLNAVPFQATPPYNCTQNWATHIQFPRCWDGIGTEHTDVTYGPNQNDCPAGNPYKLPEINVTITHPNQDRKVPRPLQVSGDDGAWLSYTSMHADYFFAAQDEFSQAVDLNGDGIIKDNAGRTYDGGYSESSLLDLCVREAPDSLAYNNERCRTGGLLGPHVRAINNYYN